MDGVLEKEISRRTLLRGAVVAAGLALASAFTACSHPENTGKLTKASVDYQDKPKDGEQCSSCRLFIASNTLTANGTCQLVEGSISPQGWCIKYIKKET